MEIYHKEMTKFAATMKFMFSFLFFHQIYSKLLATDSQFTLSYSLQNNTFVLSKLVRQIPTYFL